MAINNLIQKEEYNKKDDGQESVRGFMAPITTKGLVPAPWNPQSGGLGSDWIKNKFLDTLKIKKHWTTAPTYTPKNFFEQIVFFDDGVNKKLYLYINGAWVSTTLT